MHLCSINAEGDKAEVTGEGVGKRVGGKGFERTVRARGLSSERIMERRTAVSDVIDTCIWTGETRVLPILDEENTNSRIPLSISRPAGRNLRPASKCYYVDRSIVSPRVPHI